MWCAQPARRDTRQQVVRLLARVFAATVQRVMEALVLAVPAVAVHVQQELTRQHLATVHV